jgi:penicillin-binding protein 2
MGRITSQLGARPATGLPAVSRSGREGMAPVAPRMAIAGIIGLVVVGILVLRLWALTVIAGAEYVERADSNVIRKLPVAAPRGSILDRNNRQIVVNRELRQVVIDLQDVEGERRDQVITELGRVLAPNRFEVAEVTEELRAKVENAPPGAVEPVVLAADVRRDEVVHYLAEHQSEFPGVDVRPAYARDYVRGTLLAHALGQVGAVSEQDLEDHPTLQLIDKVGVSGLEKSYDEYLRGVNGYDAVEVDAAGVRSDSGLRGLPPTPGRNLRTTIDLRMQKVAEQALASSIAKVRGTSDGRDAKAAAAVAIDPRSGEVLTIASYPTYDPGVFTSSDPKEARIAAKLNSDEKRKPLLNRAIQGEYPAGSTFKAITAIAAMAEGYMTPDEAIGCPPSREIAQTKFPNNTSLHLGAIDLPTALEVSCNTYFYELAVHFYNAPGSPLQSWATKFGLGTRTGIDIPGESSGLVPTPEWRKETFSEYPEIDQIWKPGYSVNLSIGQGDLRVTPLQMTNAFATIGNGGTVRTPHIAKSVQEPSGRDVVDLPAGPETDLQLDQGDLAAVVDGLQRVNDGGNGTASAVFQGFPVPTAGKTGTAEMTTGSDTAWYCGFAPVSEPTIAACAVVEGGGHGGSAAAPVVLQMFQQWFGADGGNVAGGGSTD